MGEQADKRMSHSSVSISTPALQRGSGDDAVIHGAERDALQLELQPLFLKQAISMVPLEEKDYFLVPRKLGGMRPFLDLSLFNKSIMDSHMLTISEGE